MKTTKVEIVRPVVLGDRNTRAGDIVDLPEDHARTLIARGLARHASEKKGAEVRATTKKTTGGDANGKEL